MTKRVSQSVEVNPEGMTWGEWRRAVRFGAGLKASAGLNAGDTPELREALKAWRAGEDPTEYAASLVRASR